MLWQSWVDYSKPKQPAQTSQQAVAGQPNEIDAVPATPEMPSSAVVQKPTTTELLPNTTASGHAVTVETDLLIIELNTYGAGINKVWLKKYTVDIKQPDDLFQLLNDSEEDIYTAQGGLLVQGREFPTHKTLFTAANKSYSMAAGKDTLDVEFVWNSPDGITYKKIYSFHRDSYAVDIKFRVLNTSPVTWVGYQYHQFERSQPEQQGSFNPATMVPSYTGGAIYNEQDKYRKISFSDMQDENLTIITTDGDRKSVV